MVVTLVVIMVGMVIMTSMVAVIAVSAMVMCVTINEPEDGYDQSTQEDHNHLKPLFVSLVELVDNNLAAGNVDKSAARETEKDHIDNGRGFGDRHSNYDSNRSYYSKNAQQEQYLLGGVAGASKGCT